MFPFSGSAVSVKIVSADTCSHGAVYLNPAMFFRVLSLLLCSFQCETEGGVTTTPHLQSPLLLSSRSYSPFLRRTVFRLIFAAPNTSAGVEAYGAGVGTAGGVSRLCERSAAASFPGIGSQCGGNPLRSPQVQMEHGPGRWAPLRPVAFIFTSL